MRVVSDCSCVLASMDVCGILTILLASDIGPLSLPPSDPSLRLPAPLLSPPCSVSPHPYARVIVRALASMFVSKSSRLSVHRWMYSAWNSVLLRCISSCTDSIHPSIPLCQNLPGVVVFVHGYVKAQIISEQQKYQGSG